MICGGVARKARPRGLPAGVSSSLLLRRNLNELQTYVADGIPLYAYPWHVRRSYNWALCGKGGLRARFVRGRRVVAIRHSPGVGLSTRGSLACSSNRRCQRQSSVCTSIGFDEQKHDLCSAELATCFATHDHFCGGWANKCLQNSILHLARGEDRRVLHRMLTSTCSNDAGSGGCQSTVSQTNLHCVQHALRRLDLKVLVFGAQSKAKFLDGWTLGQWSLGAPAGLIIGGIAWFVDDAHVLPLCQSLLTHWPL